MFSLGFSGIYIAVRLALSRASGLPFVLNLQWALLLLIYFANEAAFVPLTPRFDAAVFMFLATFTISYHLAPTFKSQLELPRVNIPGLVYLLALVSGAFSLTMLARLGATGAIENAMSLRDMINEDSATSRFEFGVGYSFPLVMAAWYVARARNAMLLSVLFGSLAALLALASTSKIFILIFLIYLVPLSYPIERLPMKLIFGLLVAGGAAFAVLHLVLGKIVETADDDVIQALLLTLGTYLLSGLAGLALFVEGQSEFPMNAIWKPIGDLVPWLIRVPDSNILPWVQIGDWYGNVYTGLSYWLDGFGVLGAILYIALLAMTARTLFHNRSLSAIFLQRLFFIALLLIFHQDFFFASIKLWAGFLICAVLIRCTVPESSGNGTGRLVHTTTGAKSFGT